MIVSKREAFNGTHARRSLLTACLGSGLPICDRFSEEVPKCFLTLTASVDPFRNSHEHQRKLRSTCYVMSGLSVLVLCRFSSRKRSEERRVGKAAGSCGGW